MGCMLENKQQIVGEFKEFFVDVELVFVFDFKGLFIKEMFDLWDCLWVSDSVCKVIKNILMCCVIDGDSNWVSFDFLLIGINVFVLVKGDVGVGVKVVQIFQKEFKKFEIKGGFFEGKFLFQDEIKVIVDFFFKEQFMVQIVGVINVVVMKVVVGINEVFFGMVRVFKQYVEGGEG